jgi:hypothetical protein
MATLKNPVGRPKSTTPTDKKVKRDIKLVNLPGETHRMLKEYCDEHGYRISTLVSNLIKKHIQSN